MSVSPWTREFLAFTTATGLARFTEVPWLKGLVPETGASPAGSWSVGAGP